jgi:arsenate reductase
VTTVLFACVHNAGRSQMAAAFFEQLADPARARALSAGSRPADRVHPEVVAAMREVGIDLSSVRPRAVVSVPLDTVDRLVTMGCGEDACPVAPGVPVEDWDLDDPKSQSLERVREIRDDIRERVRRLVTRLELEPRA